MATSVLKSGKVQPINVYLRLRPLNKAEFQSHAAITVINSKQVAVKQQYPKTYSFTKVFSDESNQNDVYLIIVHPLISEILAGFSCTVFAYGQTGTGKTHTMIGKAGANNNFKKTDQAGIIPRAVANLFDELNLLQQEYTVRVSYVEIYNEEIFDLLADDDTSRIRLYEDQQQKGSVHIHGIQEMTVMSTADIYKFLEKGQDKCKTACTLINSRSSRSHTVFTVTVHIKEVVSENEHCIKTGKLNLVDLAGSENIGRSGAVDQQAREAGNINQSLLTLGRVIKALVERSPHIPYRESKLTRILQDSLGGRTKTSIIATISPSSYNLEETLSTLEYAHRARNITNRPEANLKLSQDVVIKQYNSEIQRLQKDLEAARTGDGIYMAKENYEILMADGANKKTELAEKINEIRARETQIGVLEDEKAMKLTQWYSMLQSFQDTRVDLEQVKEEKLLQERLVTYYEDNNNILKEQSTNLLKVVQESTTKEALLHHKLRDLYTKSSNNLDTSETLTNKLSDVTYAIKMNLKLLEGKIDNKNGDLINFVSAYHEQNKSHNILMFQNCEEMKAVRDDFFTKWRNSFSEQERDSKALLDDTNVALKMNQSMVNEMEIMWSTFIKKLQNDMGQHMEESMMFHSTLVNNLESMKKNTVKSLDDILDILTKNNDNMDHRIETILTRQDLQHAKIKEAQMLSNKMSNLMSNLSDENDDLKTVVTGINLEQEDNFKKINNKCQECISINNNLVEETVADSSKKIENLRRENFVDKIVVDISKTTGDLITNFRTAAQDCATKITTYDNSIINFNNKQAEVLTKHIDEINNCERSRRLIHENHLEIAEEKETKLIQKAINLTEVTNQYTTNTSFYLKKHANVIENYKAKFVVISHKGDTPAKTNSDFPQQLKFGSPKDRVLARLRQHNNSNGNNENVQP